MGRRIWILLLGCGLIVCLYVVWSNRQVEELRRDARTTSAWKPVTQVPTRTDLAKLSARAQWMVDSECNREGGSPFGNRNCYAEAASWMLYEARQKDSARDMAYLGLLLVSLLAGLTAATRLRKRSEWSE